MRCSVITLFPEMFAAFTEHGITRRAVSQQIINVAYFNPRDFATDKYKTVDDNSYGGGPGMVMLPETLDSAINAAKNWHGTTARVIYVSPQGKTFNQAAAKELATCSDLIFISGRYEGIDERIVSLHVDEEWSLGDYVISGGELAIMVMLDAITRMLPGAVSSVGSLEDSFMQGILDYEHYTRPEEFAGLKVPEVLLSGDHKEIAKWRLKNALWRTWQRRKDLLEKQELSANEQSILEELIKEYNGN